MEFDLTCFLRSGEPDVYDKHMAIYCANLIGMQDESLRYHYSMPGVENPSCHDTPVAVIIL
jgi:hypothetical protein